MTNCRACGAEIFWRKTKKGKLLPLDVKPIAYKENPEGKDLLFDINGDAIRCDIVEREPGKYPTGMAYKSHWATCPFADNFRKGGAKA